MNNLIVHQPGGEIKNEEEALFYLNEIKNALPSDKEFRNQLSKLENEE